MIEKTLKVNRSLHQPCSNTILIADTGSGGAEICKMAIKLASKREFGLSARDGSQNEDVRVQLRTIITETCMEFKHKSVLFLDEKEMRLGNVKEAVEALSAHGEIFHIFNREELESLLST